MISAKSAGFSEALGDLPLDRGEGVNEQLQNDARTLRQAGFWVLDEGDQGWKMGDALRKDLAVFKQMPNTMPCFGSHA